MHTLLGETNISQGCAHPFRSVHKYFRPLLTLIKKEKEKRERAWLSKSCKKEEKKKESS